MRIIHLLTHAYRASGNASAAVDLACSQADSGHDVSVYTSINEFSPLFAAHHVNVIDSTFAKGLFGAIQELASLGRLIAEMQPEVVHAHMMRGTVLASLLRPFFAFGLVTTVHNEFQRSAILMGLGQRVIGVSGAVSDAMVKRGVPKAKMRTVLNGTINSARRPNPPPDALCLMRPAVATICGMHHRKGVLDLIDAFAIVAQSDPDAHLYLVGTGPCSEEYKQHAAATAPKRVTFLGHLDDPRSVLLAADIFVLASHAEPAGLVLSEAREAGCAVVATDVGGIPEMLDGGDAGILVPPRQPFALAAAILMLLTSPNSLEKMKGRAKKGLAKFTVERVAAETMAVYSEIVRGRSR